MNEMNTQNLERLINELFQEYGTNGRLTIFFRKPFIEKHAVTWFVQANYDKKPNNRIEHYRGYGASPFDALNDLHEALKAKRLAAYSEVPTITK